MVIKKRRSQHYVILMWLKLCVFIEFIIIISSDGELYIFDECFSYVRMEKCLVIYELNVSPYKSACVFVRHCVVRCEYIFRCKVIQQNEIFRLTQIFLIFFDCFFFNSSFSISLFFVLILVC